MLKKKKGGWGILNVGCAAGRTSTKVEQLYKGDVGSVTSSVSIMSNMCDMARWISKRQCTAMSRCASIGNARKYSRNEAKSCLYNMVRAIMGRKADTVGRLTPLASVGEAPAAATKLHMLANDPALNREKKKKTHGEKKKVEKNIYIYIHI